MLLINAPLNSLIMDFTFFEQLTKKDAELYLERFLSEETGQFNKMLSVFKAEHVTIDFSIESIFSVIEWVKLNLKTIPEKKDESLPFWIKESDSYMNGLYSFDEISRILILRTSYYFGECFIRTSKKLSWGIGQLNTAVYNMPVVTGFKKKMELAPMLICENLIRRLVEEDDPSIINTALDYWRRLI